MFGAHAWDCLDKGPTGSICRTRSPPILARVSLDKSASRTNRGDEAEILTPQAALSSESFEYRRATAISFEHLRHSSRCRTKYFFRTVQVMGRGLFQWTFARVICRKADDSLAQPMLSYSLTLGCMVGSKAITSASHELDRRIVTNSVATPRQEGATSERT
jgi:hypothetical protein